MRKIHVFVIALVCATSTAAFAGGQADSIGIGAEYQLSGVGGVSMNYDAGKFHAGAAIGFADPPGPNNTDFDIEGRFFYHVHSTAMADFSLGGSLGLSSVPDPAGGRDADMYIEPSFQIRLFLASNVALSFTGGISIGIIDASGVAITGQGLNGTAGVHYYFF